MAVHSSASEQGAIWSAQARDWAELWAQLAEPARRLLLDATGVGPRTRLLDVGCGSGELCALAAARGAGVSGIDAADGMVAIARERVPDAELRVGGLEELPWADGAFDVVAAVNALQFATNIVAAIADAARVTRDGGRVAICNWGVREDCDVNTVDDAIGELAEPLPDAAAPSAERRAVRLPGGLTELARRGGLHPLEEGTVSAPWSAPDQATLERAFTMDAELPGVSAAQLRAVILDAAAPFCRPDGSYHLENRFHYVIAEATGAVR